MLVLRSVLSRRLRRAVFERVKGRDFVIWPGVFNPVVFRTGRFFAQFMEHTPLLDIPAGCERTALDMGTGCGILAVFAAARGYRVTAVDIEPRRFRARARMRF